MALPWIAWIHTPASQRSQGILDVGPAVFMSASEKKHKGQAKMLSFDLVEKTCLSVQTRAQGSESLCGGGPVSEGQGQG